MARHSFGGGASDFVASNGRPRAGVTVTFWTAQTGGTQVTDLLDANGAAITQVTSGVDGQIPVFQGPDGVTELWALAGGARVRLDTYRIDELAAAASSSAASAAASASAAETAAAGAVQRANHTGTQPAATISDFNTAAVEAGKGTYARRDVVAATRRSDLSEHDFTTNGAWCWFNGPLVVDYEGSQRKRYAGWVADGGDIVIGSWDLSTGDKRLFTLRVALNDDDHAAPGIIVLPDGRVMAFYSPHGGPGYSRTTTSPEDITAWDAEVALGLGDITYPKPMQLGSRLFLFYRGGTGTTTNQTQFVYSDDDGVTWSAPRLLWHTTAEAAAPPYVHVHEYDGVAHFLASNSHPSHASGAQNALYHFSFDGTTFAKTDGTAIYTLATLPAAGLALADATQVYDGVSNGKGWGWDLAVGADGPVVVFASFPTDDDHRYNYGRWTGAAWVTGEITAAGGKLGTSVTPGMIEANYSGGIALVQDDPSVVYLSRQVDPGGQFEIERWATTDSGTSWTAAPVTVESREPQARPMTPRNPLVGTPEVLWQAGVYRDYTDFDTRIVTGAEPVAAALHRAALARPKAAPAFIGVETVATNGTAATSVGLVKPTGTKRGDLLLAFLNVNGTATAITPPTGWTLGQTSGSYISRRSWYWKVADSDTAETFTFTFDGSHPHAASLQAWRGVETATPVNATGIGESASVLPTIHPQAGRSRLLFLMGGSAHSTGEVSVVPDARLTERFDVTSIASTRWLGNASADVVIDRVGRLDDYTVTMTNVQAGANFAVALTPGGGTADLAEHEHPLADHSHTLDRVWLSADNWQVGAGVGTAPSKTHLGNRWSAWLMDASGAERVTQNLDLPAGWTTANADLYWTNASTGTGDIAAQLFVTTYAEGETTGKTVTSLGAVTATAPAQNTLKVTRLATGFAVTAGFASILLDRLGGNAEDTLPNDAGFVALLLTKAS